MENLSAIEFFRDGIPFYQNDRTKNLSLKLNHPDLAFFYESFLECFGSSVHDISQERYLNDLFLISYSLSPALIVGDEKLVSKSSTDRYLSPISAGTLDCSLKFSSPLSENFLIYFCSIGNAIVKFDQNGIPLEE